MFPNDDNLSWNCASFRMARHQLFDPKSRRLSALWENCFFLALSFGSALHVPMIRKMKACKSLELNTDHLDTAPFFTDGWRHRWIVSHFGCSLENLFSHRKIIEMFSLSCLNWKRLIMKTLMLMLLKNYWDAMINVKPPIPTYLIYMLEFATKQVFWLIEYSYLSISERPKATFNNAVRLIRPQPNEISKLRKNVNSISGSLYQFMAPEFEVSQKVSKSPLIPNYMSIKNISYPFLTWWDTYYSFIYYRFKISSF